MSVSMNVDFNKENGWTASKESTNVWHGKSIEDIFKNIYKENFRIQFMGSSYYYPSYVSDQIKYDEWYSNLTVDEMEEMENGLEQPRTIEAVYEGDEEDE